MATPQPGPCPDLDSMSAEDVIRWASGEFGERLCLTCSWQKQSSVLVHMVSELGLGIDVIELDTHLFFRESYETRDRLVERYGLNLLRPEIARSPSSTATRARTCGSAIPTAAATSARSSRCSRRSRPTGPGSPASAATSRRAARRRRSSNGRRPTASGRCIRWPTGTRSASGPTSTINEIPYNPLHDVGYRSIGCIPCTRPVAPDEEERAGRWAGSDKLECGIHLEKEVMTRAHLRARAPGVGAPPRRRLHALVHRPLGRRKDDDRPPGRARARPARARRRVPGRRHRSLAPVEGPRLLEGGPRHEHRARSAGSPRG